MHQALLTKHVLFTQIEFYFSDSNLYRDNFLLEQVKSDKDGFVDIALLCTFVRLQRLLGLPGSHGVTALPESTVHDVADALKDSSTLVVSEDKRRVRRIIVRS
jgi:lupus La protein